MIRAEVPLVTESYDDRLGFLTFVGLMCYEKHFYCFTKTLRNNIPNGLWQFSCYNVCGSRDWW